MGNHMLLPDSARVCSSSDFIQSTVTTLFSLSQDVMIVFVKDVAGPILPFGTASSGGREDRLKPAMRMALAVIRISPLVVEPRLRTPGDERVVLRLPTARFG